MWVRHLVGTDRWFNSKEAQAQQKTLDGSWITLTEPQVQGSSVPYKQVFPPEQLVIINYEHLYLDLYQEPNSGYCELLETNAAAGQGWRKGGREGGWRHTEQAVQSPETWLTLNVFLPTITILFLIVGKLGLLVGLILTHVPIVPIVVRQLRAVLRIYRGLVLIKEAACRRQRRASSGKKGSRGSCRKTEVEILHRNVRKSELKS